MVRDIKHILYATDLSGSARRAMGYAVALANAFGAALSVIHVINETSPNAEMLITAFLGYCSKQELEQKSRGQVTEEVTSRLSRICEELGCQLPDCRFALADVMVEFGRPTELILNKAEEGPYDVLVIGRHDYGLIDSALMGHATKGLLRHCPIPVMMVPVDESPFADTGEA